MISLNKALTLECIDLLKYLGQLVSELNILLTIKFMSSYV